MMMDGSASVSTFLSPPLTLSPPSNYSYVQFDDNSFISDGDGTTYCIYDPTHAFQIVLQQEDDHAIGSEAIAFSFADTDGHSVPVGDGSMIFKLQVEPTEPSNSALQLMSNEATEPVKTELDQPHDEYTISNEVSERTEQEPIQESDSPGVTLPTFYHNDLPIGLSSDSETHETYLPLSFDEASHFLFHGREECVITTDIPIPTVESSSFSTSSTSTNSFDSGISNTSGSVKKKYPKKPKPPKRQIVDTSITINRKVYKCPHPDCKFWAARGHRFHEHMGTHDTVRPFGCSACTYETNWKSDVKKHIARMIERNAADHENAVLTRVSEKQVDTDRYKECLIDLDVPVAIYSGKIGEPSRSNTNSKKNKTSNSTSNTPETKVFSGEHDGLISSTTNSMQSFSPPRAPAPKKSRATKPKKIKSTSQPIIMVTQIIETQQELRKPPEIYIPPLASCINTHTTTEAAMPVSTVSRDEAHEAFEETKATASEGEAPEVDARELLSRQDTITTDDGITVKIVPQPGEEPAVPSSTTFTPTPTAKPKPKKRAAAVKKSISGKTDTQNQMAEFRQLHSCSPKPTPPTIVSSTAVPAKASAPVNTYSRQSSEDFIKRGETSGNVHQYFLVVENGHSSGINSSCTSTRVSRKLQLENPNLECDTCPFIAADYRGFVQHKRFHGSSDENLIYTCPHCNFKSATRKDMEQHKSLHAENNGKRRRLNDYSRSNLKRSENTKIDDASKI